MRQDRSAAQLLGHERKALRVLEGAVRHQIALEIRDALNPLRDISARQGKGEVLARWDFDGSHGTERRPSGIARTPVSQFAESGLMPRAERIRRGVRNDDRRVEVAPVRDERKEQ